MEFEKIFLNASTEVVVKPLLKTIENKGHKVYALNITKNNSRYFEELVVTSILDVLFDDSLHETL